jgi:hypothetical protein
MKLPLVAFAVASAITLISTMGVAQNLDPPGSPPAGAQAGAPEGSSAGPPPEQGPDEFPFDVIPAANPADLQQIAALSDNELLARLFDGAPLGQAPGLQRFFPAGTRVFPMSHGFAGARDACLKQRSVVACRLHLQDLYKINANRRAPPGLMNNPFSRAP